MRKQVILICLLVILLVACRFSKATTTVETPLVALGTSTASPTPVPSSTSTGTPAAAPTRTNTPSPTSTRTIIPSSTPTPTATPVPTPALPALAEGNWPALPRLLFEKADHSLWAATFDRGQPWEVTGQLPEGTSAVHWAVSPDGRWLAAVQSIGWRNEQAAGTLFLVHLETEQVHLLLVSLLPSDRDWRDLPPDADRAALWENQPAWSPDSSKLAFVSAHEGRADLYVYDVSSHTTEHVAGSDEGNVAWPQWSPDGAWLLYHTIAYFGTGAGPTGGALWAVSPVDSTAPRQLTPQDRFELVVGWLDNRRAFAFQHAQPSPRDVTLIDIASGERTLLLGGPVLDVSWSDAAQMLAVTPYENPDYAPGVWLIDPRQPDPSLLDDRYGRVSPRWSPDGRYLIYNGDQACILYEPRTGQTALKPEAWFHGHWSPHDQYIAHTNHSLQLIDVQTGQIDPVSSHPAFHLRWSPDGEWLIWLRQSGEKFDLFARRAAGGTLRPIAYQVARDALQRLAWVPSEEIYLPPVTITQMVDSGQQIETQPAMDESTHVVFLRDRLLFRANWYSEAERVGQACILDRQYPGSNLYMTDALYASLKSASNGNWVAVENDDHATCVVDTQSGEGYVLPAHARVSWEPRGTRFAYVAGSQAADSSQETALYLYDTQTHIAEPFFEAKGLFEAIWSPDGAHIAVCANYAGVPLTYSVLDVHTGEVRYTGPYDMWPGDYLRWSTDGARLAVSRKNTETLQCEWDVLDIASGEMTRLSIEAVSQTGGWQPDDVERHRTARSHSGRYLARAQLTQRSSEAEWWTQPSMVSISDLETGETVREWQVDGLVPAVRWSAGDGWLVLGVLQVQDVACEYPEFGPCGIYSSVWRLPVNSTGESDDLNRPERVIDDGFLVEVVTVN